MPVFTKRYKNHVEGRDTTLKLTNIVWLCFRKCAFTCAVIHVIFLVIVSLHLLLHQRNNEMYMQEFDSYVVCKNKAVWLATRVPLSLLQDYYLPSCSSLNVQLTCRSQSRNRNRAQDTTLYGVNKSQNEQSDKCPTVI